MSDNIPVFPVATITIGPVAALKMVIIRLDFLSHMTQQPSEAQPGRKYALTATQCRHVILQTQKALAILESAAPSPSGSPLH